MHNTPKIPARKYSHTSHVKTTEFAYIRMLFLHLFTIKELEKTVYTYSTL